MSEFLDKLESKIDALDESERKKIIKKYQKEIETKIKNGKTEEEAIEEIGNIDNIAKEICEDYHVNLVNRKKTLQEKINSGIEECATFLAHTCEEVIDYTKKSTKDNFLVTFFEIMLKIVILVMLFMICKIPFILCQEGLNIVFDLLFYPFDMALAEIFEYIISIIYGAVCIALSVYMFKDYFIKDNELVKKVDKIVDEKNKEKIEQKEKKINYAIMIIKVLIMFIVIIPMMFLNIVFLGLTILAVYLIIKGVSVVGLAIILLSFFLLTLVMTTYVTDAMDSRDRNHLFALCISVISLIIGIVLFIDDLTGYNYPETLDNSHFKTKNESVTIEIDKETDFIILNAEINNVIDNNIEDNKVLVEVTYYDDFVDINLEHIINEDMDSIVITSNVDDFDMNDYINMYDVVLEDLKDNNIFKYGDLDKYKVTVYYNETTEELIK